MKKYSHVAGFTRYMMLVADLVNKTGRSQEILDIPAGNGLLAEKLTEDGHKVTCGDINEEKENYVYINMEQPFSLENERFDTVICLEGLEHVVNPSQLISELCRVSRNGGRIIISTPNIQNLYSRLQFLCTGTFFQFEPFNTRRVVADELIDRGHISPLSYTQLKYLFEECDASLEEISGDKYKRKVLIPFLLPFMALGYLWFKTKKLATGYESERDKFFAKGFFNKNILFSRSLILVFKKNL